MSILTYPLGFIGGGKEFYNNVMENSLRFDDGSSSKLQRTFSNDYSDKGTWTYSFCIKQGDISHNYSLTIEQFESSGTAGFDFIRFGVSDTIMYTATGGVDYGWRTGAKYRDPGAWYHVVFQSDTSNATADDRYKVFINGKRDTSGTMHYDAPPQNHQWPHFGDASFPISIGFYDDADIYSDCHVTDIYHVQGYALGPENFGEYKEGVWIPKAYAGPPPIITDSSNSNYAITQKLGNVKLEYDDYYIGESAIYTNADVLQTDHTTYKFLHDDTTNYTIDFWYYNDTNFDTTTQQIFGSSESSSHV